MCPASHVYGQWLEAVIAVEKTSSGRASDAARGSVTLSVAYRGGGGIR